MFGFTYINGNPAVREKTRAVISIIVKSIVLGFACIGVGRTAACPAAAGAFLGGFPDGRSRDPGLLAGAGWRTGLSGPDRKRQLTSRVGKAASGS